MKYLYQKHKQFIPLILMVWMSSVTVIAAFRGEISFTQKNYIGFAVVLINLIAYFFLRKYFKEIFLILLFLGLLNVYEYAAAESTLSAGYGSWQIGLQFTSVIIALVTYSINFRRTNDYLLSLLTSKEDTTAIDKLEKVNKFRIQYQHKTDEELLNIISDSRFVPEAIEVAKQIIAERQGEIS